MRRVQGRHAKEHGERHRFATIGADYGEVGQRWAGPNPRVMTMAKAKQELTWTEIDPASLPQQVRDHYDYYKDAYKAMKTARQDFETALNAAVNPPAGKRVVCGYNFGKLSIALADAAPEKPTQAKGSLADFLASAQSSGRRV